MSEDASPGAVMMAIGGLIAALCGGCTLHFLTTSNQYDRAWSGVALVLGGVPALIGAILFAVGFSMMVRERRGDQ